MNKNFTLALITCLGVRSMASTSLDSFANRRPEGGTRYAPGASLIWQSNGRGNDWFGVTNTPEQLTVSGPVIVPENLSFPGLPPSAGNSVSIPSSAGNMGRWTLGFAARTGTVYYSFLLKVTDVSKLDDSGRQNNFFAALGDNVGSQNATLRRATARLYARRFGNGYKLGIARNSDAPEDWEFDSTERQVGEVLFVVAAYDNDKHVAKLWINPESSTFRANIVPPPAVTAEKGADLNASGVRSFVLGCRTVAPPACIVDELRVGTSWAGVTGALLVEHPLADQTLNGGASARWSVDVAGTPPFTFQWKKGETILQNEKNISGATSDTLVLSELSSQSAGRYAVQVTDATGQKVSSSAELRVNDPAISVQPAHQVSRLNSNATFQVSVASSTPATFQWFKDGAPLRDGANVSGSTSDTLKIQKISDKDIGAYHVQVTSAAQPPLTSSNANLYLATPSVDGSRPNIIFILCDDLGYGDLGVLYQKDRPASLPRESTPRLDTLAAEGIQLRRSYCSAPICAPSRASLLLGLHQGHANVRNQEWDKALADDHTLASVLKQAGYATAVIGKWGLGGDDVGGTTPAEWAAYPTRRGFDYFFGYERHGDGHEHYPKEAITSNRSKNCYDGTENVTPSLDKCYTTDLFTARAKKWIEDQHEARPQQPFFVYLAFDTPHAAYELPTQAYPAGGGTNGGLQWIGAPGHMINTASGTIDSYIPPDYANATYHADNNPATPPVAWPEIFKRYAASVRRIDEAVGDIMKLLKDLNVDDNTLVVFTSDNGPTTEDYLHLTPRYRANFFDTFGFMDGVKRDAYEGGIRMPTLVRWPSRIPAGSISMTPSEFQDWLPTFSDAAGLPSPARSDGVSLLPTLTGKGVQSPSTIYVEFADTFTIPSYPEFEASRRGRERTEMQVIGLEGLQGVRYNVKSQSDDFEIYDVVHDPKEVTNLAANVQYAGLQQRMKDRVLQLRRPDADAPRPYDNELVPADSVSNLIPGVNWSAYEGGFPWVPELTSLPPVTKGAGDSPSLGILPRQKDVAALFTGYIEAPADGDYTFHLSTDAGALLRIHEATVINADHGYDAGSKVNGTIRLKKGMHSFRLYYSRQASSSSPELNVSWSGPGFSETPISQAKLFRRAD